MSKQPPPAPTASAIGPCPTVIKIVGRPGTGSLPSITLKAQITTAADDSLECFYCFSEKIRLEISYESSARQRIHMKYQALFSSKDKSKK